MGYWYKSNTHTKIQFITVDTKNREITVSNKKFHSVEECTFKTENICIERNRLRTFSSLSCAKE